MDHVSEKRAIFVLACLSCLTISFNTAAISAVIPAISLSLHSPELIVSRVISYYMVPYGLGALFYAPLTRFITYRNVLAITSFLYAIACFVGANAVNYSVISLACVGMGVAAASFIPLGLMLIGDLYDQNIRGRMVGIFFGTSFIASLGGIILSGLADWRWLFIVPSVMALIMSGLYVFLNLPELRRVHYGSVNYIKAFENKNLREIFLFILILSSLYHGVNKWFGVYLANDYAFDKFKISLFFVMMTIASFVGQISGGWLTDKIGRGISCKTGLVGLSSGAILLAWHYNSEILLAIVLILFSISWTVGHNGISTILTDYSERERPITASLNSAVRFVSGGIGFYLSGFIVKFSFSLGFLILGFMMLMLILWLNKVIIGYK